MGIGGIGIWQLVIILIIVLMLFGTKKLRNMGSDLGGALKGFKKAMRDDEEEREQSDPQALEDESVTPKEPEGEKSSARTDVPPTGSSSENR